MRELRTCPVTGRVVLLNDAWVDAPPAPAPTPALCPFCTDIGPAIAVDGPVRALPHPVPALGIEGDARPVVAAGAVRRDAVGAHELVFGAHVEADAGLLRMVSARLGDLRRDARLRGFTAIRRYVPHGHAVWQIFAVPFDLAPSAPGRWRDTELESGLRVVETDDHTVSLLAWAPRAPFEAWVMPARGIARFEHSDPAPVAEAAARLVRRISRTLRGAAVDLVLVDGEPWRIELMPRLAPPEAVEVAAGIALHGTFPEAAAEHLRAMLEAAT